MTLTSAGARLNTNTELRYYPYGVARYTAGTTPTSFNFTGQRKDSGSGLLFYNARWYDPVVGRFLQADTLVPSPGDPQSLNRYSYTLNNPLIYRDPTGHGPECSAIFMGDPLTGAMTMLCQVVTTAGSYWPEIQALAVQYGPQASQLLQQWADKLPALVDQAGQLVKGAQQTASQAGNTADSGGLDPNKGGKWVERSEPMSDRARAYQEFVTGKTGGKVYQVNGINFDGIRDGVLLDAKGYYKQFVDPSAGTFKTWWRGADDFVQQAQRQMEAARGAQIEWHFNEMETLEAVRKLFADRGIGSGIKLILNEMP